jgi:hypothetical protein
MDQRPNAFENIEFLHKVKVDVLHFNIEESERTDDQRVVHAQDQHSSADDNRELRHRVQVDVLR